MENVVELAERFARVAERRGTAAAMGMIQKIENTAVQAALLSSHVVAQALYMSGS